MDFVIGNVLFYGFFSVVAVEKGEMKVVVYLMILVEYGSDIILLMFFVFNEIIF